METQTTETNPTTETTTQTSSSPSVTNDSGAEKANEAPGAGNPPSTSDKGSDDKATPQETTPLKEGEGDKGKAEEKAVEYSFKAPAGVEIPPAYIDGLTEVAKKHGLTNEVGQEIVDRFARVQIEQQKAAADALTADWEAKAKADPELTEENQAIARRALKEFGNAELEELFKAAPMLEKHPGLNKLLLKIGKAVSEDTFVKGDRHSSAQSFERGRRLHPELYE